MPELDLLSDVDLAMMHHVLGMADTLANEGVHPFAALLVDGNGNILMEQGNAYLPDHDMTGHAERVLMTRASKTWCPDFLAGCTMYVSAEPCCMCAGAAYWAGLGRVVYGVSENRLKSITGNHPENPTLDLPCRKVFESGQRKVEVIGPVMENEAAKVHETFWQAHGQ
jgi:tRNA(Arg) A34 adenosine deaminase TadA|tara:strand:+ start:5954 stop:6457 length:504 start_codon:yes stop_codon:yes gene_type:complete